MLGDSIHRTRKAEERKGVAWAARPFAGVRFRKNPLEHHAAVENILHGRSRVSRISSTAMFCSPKSLRFSSRIRSMRSHAAFILSAGWHALSRRRAWEGPVPHALRRHPADRRSPLSPPTRPTPLVGAWSPTTPHPADRRSPLHTTGDLRSGRRHGQATVPQQGEKAGHDLKGCRGSPANSPLWGSGVPSA
jgi:hypothetical protein